MKHHLDATIELDSSDAAPTVARRFVDEHSDDLPTELVADAELLVTELVTNAVRHGRPRIFLRVSLEPPLMGVRVSDGGAETLPTTPRVPATGASGGRGLLIVERLSSQWGVVPHEAGPGKTVWFELTASSYR